MRKPRVVNSRMSQLTEEGKLLPPDGSSYVLPTASPTTKGGVRVGSNLSMAGDVLSADDMRYDDTAVLNDIDELQDGQQSLQDQIDEIGPPYVLPTASPTTKGGVRVGSNLSMAGDVLSADDMRYDDTAVLNDIDELQDGQQSLQDQIDEIGPPYVLPTASPTVKGGVRVGSNLSMAGDVLSADDMRYDDTQVRGDITTLEADVAGLQEQIDDLPSGLSASLWEGAAPATPPFTMQAVKESFNPATVTGEVVTCLETAVAGVITWEGTFTWTPPPDNLNYYPIMVGVLATDPGLLDVSLLPMLSMAKGSAAPLVDFVRSSGDLGYPLDWCYGARVHYLIDSTNPATIKVTIRYLKL